jgi:NhaP-type Na+/H+ and K+/H+ antiporter
VAIDFNIHILLQLLFSPYGKTQRTLVILQVEITRSLQLSSLGLLVTTPLVAINLPEL